MAQFPLSSLPKPQAPLTLEGQHIDNVWYMAFVQLITDVSNGGDVIGPASSLNNQIVLFDGTTGKMIKGATGTGYVRTDAGVYSTPTHAATSVLGRAAGTSGDMADITATVDGTVLKREGGVLVWATGASLGGYWSELTNGDPVSPELLFDSFGDTIDLFVPTP